MTKRIDLLKFLNEPKSFTEISEKFVLSNMGIDELITNINEIERDLIRKNGLERYFLTRKLEWLLIANINNLLKTNKLNDYQCQIIDETLSTNSYALDRIESIPNKTIITAEYQSQGRGRSNKRWISRVATDLTVSFIYWFDICFQIELLPLITAVAINRLLKDYNIQSKIKWPNDVLLNSGDKVSGILVESGIRDNRRFAIIGIGLDKIFDIARYIVLVELTRNLDNVINEYATFGFNLLKQEWLDNCIHYQKLVKIIRDEIIIDSGINTGITENGALLINNSSGSVKEYNSANINLRW